MRKQTSKRKVITGIIAAIVLIGAFAFGMHLIESRGLLDQQFGDTGGWNEDEPETILDLDGKRYVSNDDIKVYLIAGTDGGGQDKGEGYNGSLADFIAVLVMDNTTQKYAIYQIDRNSMTNVMVMNKSGEFSDYAYEQICTAHWYGRTDDERNGNLVLAASELLGGLDFDGYYVLNMEDIGKVNDAIGGVVVNIEDDMTEVDPAFIKGSKVLLTDKQAEKYLRARMNVGDGTNAGRMRRQKQYMQNAYDMVIGQLRENPEYINDLYSQLKYLVQSDSGAKDMSVVADHLTGYTGLGFLEFSGETKVGDAINEGTDHEEFYVDQASIVNNLKKVIDLREDGESTTDESE